MALLFVFFKPSCLKRIPYTYIYMITIQEQWVIYRLFEIMSIHVQVEMPALAQIKLKTDHLRSIEDWFFLHYHFYQISREQKKDFFFFPRNWEWTNIFWQNGKHGTISYNTFICTHRLRKESKVFLETMGLLKLW